MPIRKFPIPEKPDSFDEPYKFPEDLTVLNSDELGKWMSRLTAYKGYVMYLLAKAEINAMFEESRHKMMVAQECADREGRGTATSIKNEVAALEQVRELQQKIDDHKKDTIFYTMLKDVYQSQGDVVSREISRRQRT